MKSVLDIFNDPRAWSPIGGGSRYTVVGGQSISGENVTPDTALGVCWYFAGMRVIAEDMGMLSLEVFRTTATGKEKAEDSPFWDLLHDRANPDMSSRKLVETLTGHAIGWHGGYAEIVVDGSGRVTLWPIHPSRVTIKRREAPPHRVYYEVRNDDISRTFKVVELEPENVLHIYGLGDDGLSGWPIPSVGKQSLGTAMSLIRAAARTFQNAVPSLVVKGPLKKTPEQKDEWRKEWQNIYGGGGGGVAIIDPGHDVQPLSLDPQKQQMLESRQFSIIEIAAILRVAPYKMQWFDRMTWGNIEHVAIEHVQSTLGPWIKRFEDEIWWKILRPVDPRLVAKFNVNDFLRGDSKTRAEFLQKAIQSGGMTINERRRLEELPPVPGGDRLYMPVNVAPVAEDGTLEVPEGKQAAQPSEPPGGGGRPTENRSSGMTLAFARTAIELCNARDCKRVHDAARKYAGNEREFGEWTTRQQGDTSEKLTAALRPVWVAMESGRPEADFTAHTAAMAVSRMAKAREYFADESTGYELDADADARAFVAAMEGTK